MKNKILGFLFLPGILLAQLSIDAEPMVSVRIVHTLDSLVISFESGWVASAADRDEVRLDAGSEFVIRSEESWCRLVNGDSLILTGDTLKFIPESAGSTVTIQQVPFGIGWWWGGAEDRNYDGTLTIYLGDSRNLIAVITLPLEEYLKGVVPYEIGPTAPMEALKAQAVAARSEAIMALTSNLYSGPGYDLTSDVECQVFSGNDRRTAQADGAVEATRSLILAEQDKPIHAFYASNCGGHSEMIQNVWPNRELSSSYAQAGMDAAQRRDLALHNERELRRWVRSSPDVYCNPELNASVPEWSRKNFRWSRFITTANLNAELKAREELGKLKRIKVLERGASGRATRCQLVFANETLVATGELAIRQLFEPPLRSAAFYARRTLWGFKLRGAGWGHGVGMCQTGAISMASQGVEFDSILEHYYPEADLVPAY